MNVDRDQIADFLKQNLLFVSLGCIGLICLSIGLIELFKPKQSQNLFPPIGQVKSATTASSSLTIDVEGAVLHPGVYRLKDGDRVQDALIAAGGLSQSADRDYVSKNINQALKITDSMKIYVPAQGEQAPASADFGSALISVNTASSTDLDSLPGVGPATAGKIIAGRPYTSLDELVTKKAVSQTEFEKIKDQIQL